MTDDEIVEVVAKAAAKDGKYSRVYEFHRRDARAALSGLKAAGLSVCDLKAIRAKVIEEATNAAVIAIRALGEKK